MELRFFYNSTLGDTKNRGQTVRSPRILKPQSLNKTPIMVYIINY